jgi:PEP-CTERM motif-containing protein
MSNFYDCSEPELPKHHTLGQLVHHIAHKITHPFQHHYAICGEPDLQVVTVEASPDIPQVYPPGEGSAGGGTGYTYYGGGGITLYTTVPLPLCSTGAQWCVRDTPTPYMPLPERPQHSVPEPSSVAILCAGVLLVLVAQWRRRTLTT